MQTPPNVSLWQPLAFAQAYLSGLRDAAAIVRKHQTPLKDHHEFALIIVRSPAYLGVVSLIPLLVATGMTGLPFRQLSILANTAIIGAAALLLVACVYLWLGRWFYEGVKRNIPYIWIDCAFYTVAHVLYHLVFGPLVFDPSFDRSIERFSNTYPGALVLTALSMAYFVHDARRKLSHHPELVPLFWPVSRDVALRIDGFGTTEVRAVYYMQSQNKGTLVVTDQGTSVLRRPLTEAIAELPLPAGLRCHRSLWVAADQVQDVIYLNGNPHVVLACDGAALPVSRACVSALRAMMAAQKGQDAQVSA